nr:MAG TPA: hypothetical protein [Caudoviricetes sp.]DAR33213.1 MAG TPA: hypothetical protein [Caudoviricetes sp.]
MDYNFKREKSKILKFLLTFVRHYCIILSDKR